MRELFSPQNTTQTKPLLLGSPVETWVFFFPSLKWFLLVKTCWFSFSLKRIKRLRIPEEKIFDNIKAHIMKINPTHLKRMIQMFLNFFLTMVVVKNTFYIATQETPVYTQSILKQKFNKAIFFILFCSILVVKITTDRLWLAVCSLKNTPTPLPKHNSCKSA